MNTIDHYLNEGVNFMNPIKKTLKESILKILTDMDLTTSDITELEEIEVPTKDGTAYVSVYFSEPAQYNEENDSIDMGKIEDIQYSGPDSNEMEDVDKKTFKEIEKIVKSAIESY